MWYCERDSHKGISIAKANYKCAHRSCDILTIPHRPSRGQICNSQLIKDIYPRQQNSRTLFQML